MPERNWDNAETKDFQEECYRLYQLDWMMAHGKSVADLGIAVLRNLDGGPIDANREADEFAIWERESGFGGEIWACLDEFLDAEYKDRDYMLRLLPGEMHARYTLETMS